MRKTRVLIHTDLPLAKTGFGKHAKNILEYLYRTGKYELCNLAVGVLANAPDLARMPWKTIGTVEPQKVEALRNINDPKAWDNISRMAGYGQFAVDEAIQSFKPDVYIAIQDIWGINYSADRPWFKNLTTALWTTLDSLPILPTAVECSKKAPNFWSWADFATKAMHKAGLKNVKTVRGTLNTEHFRRLSTPARMALREKFKIPQDAFIIGFVFRNQLRKSVPNLIQGFKQFKMANPESKAKLLLHTHWNEGWPIQKLCEEHGVPLTDVLTTFVCRQCQQYEIKNFSGQHEVNCPMCGAPNGQVTTGPGFGVSESQLNEVYNLMDVYCHPFTSGGQEIPIQEAKLTELVTLVTNYSCGEDSCEEGSGSLPLEWAEYREPDTNFIKASTYPSSIAKQLGKVWKMKPEAKAAMGKQARQWVIDNFQTEKIGKFLEEFIDAAPQITDESVFSLSEKKNSCPNYQIPVIEDNAEWILHMYKHILDQPIDRDNDGFKHWMQRLASDLNRQQVEEFFRYTANQELIKEQSKNFKFDSLLNPNDTGRVLVVMPDNEADVYLATSLFQSIKNRYPNYALYVASKPQHKIILDGNPLVDRWIEYAPIMDNAFWLEGSGSNKGYFNIAYLLQLTTKQSAFTHNGEDKLDLDTAVSQPSPTGFTGFFYDSPIMMTGIPPRLSDLRKSPINREGLETIGFFFDDKNNLVDASQLDKYL